MPSDDEIKRNIAANIHRLLEKRGWKVSDLIRESQELPNNVYRAHRGTHMIGSGILARIAEALDTSADFLMADPPKPAAKNFQKVG